MKKRIFEPSQKSSKRKNKVSLKQVKIEKINILNRKKLIKTENIKETFWALQIQQDTVKRNQIKLIKNKN